MFIHEAVKKAMDIGGLISRQEYEGTVRIQPTDSCEGFILINSNNVPHPRWQPRAEDIIAEDWIVTRGGQNESSQGS